MNEEFEYNISKNNYKINVNNNGVNIENCPFPSKYVYGFTYVPCQILNEVFTPGDGLNKGTIFPELVSGYNPNQSSETIKYLMNSGEQRRPDYAQK